MTDLETIRRLRNPAIDRPESMDTETLLKYVDRSNPEVRALSQQLERYVRATAEFRDMVATRCGTDVAEYWEMIY